MKIFHLALISVVVCALQKEEISKLLDEIIENSINKIETESANFAGSVDYSPIPKVEEEVAVLGASEEKEEEEIIETGNNEKITDETTVVNSDSGATTEIITVEGENKNVQKPAPQNKFLLLFTSFMVMIISMAIAILVGYCERIRSG